MLISAPLPGNATFYHHGKKDQKRNRVVDQADRKFIAWDGEGINIHGPGKPQSYVLFGSSEGHISDPQGLDAFACLDHIIETGMAHPGAVHIGFGFGYDSNMIVASLAPATLARLHRDGWVRVTRKADGARFSITFAKGKYFRVTRYKTEYHPKHNSTAKTTVQIFDVFSFFMCSFIKAYKDLVGPLPDIINTGKAARKTFALADWDAIHEYWAVEIQLLKELGIELRRRVFNAGLRIRQWHGPGALASYALTAHGMKSHMMVGPDAVREAARYGYAGGRFELFKVGRIQGPIYGVDINSAYPHAISMLPSLQGGEWRHVTNPEKVTRFGIYKVSLHRGNGFDSSPSPLFHRDRQSNISFPWISEGWYWSPEAWIAKQSGGVISEGWEFVGSGNRPFEWITDMYAQRREWKQRGISAQLALKLCMNSMYGKLAQRVGWNETSKRLPPFHQLEWAGWVTSYVRARLYSVMARIPFDRLIAVETDGIYTTMQPDRLGISDGSALGEWEVTEYEEILYVQSGLAWLRHRDGCVCGKCSGGWESKRRGLDPCREGHAPRVCDCPGTFSLGAAERYLASLHPNPDASVPWPVYKGETTRFVGLGQALQSRSRLEAHCVWVTEPREISPGLTGKRVHVRSECAACAAGATALELGHDLVIRSLSTVDPQSYPHDIPWEPGSKRAAWRDVASDYDDVTSQYV